jgi:hypothetical protein
MDSFESLDIIRCQHTNNELSYEWFDSLWKLIHN